MRQPSAESDRHADSVDPDMELVCAIRQKDPDAWGVLEQRYREPLLWYLKRLTNDDHIAEDAYQCALAIVYKGISTFRGPRFKAWLYKIAKHEAIRQNKKRKTHQQELDFIATRRSADCPPAAFNREMLDAIPEKQKEVLVHRFIDGLQIRQTAMLMHVSVRTVNRLIVKAIASLRQILDAEDLL